MQEGRTKDNVLKKKSKRDSFKHTAQNRAIKM